ncbi:uncharacterized protein B0T23DRAFT_408665 [Neurospora hispaniola]|uniref:Uncharacterized protein n=1 Tax=Neurospora hispaniola TaxID=588809 RepID=A0AAJ0MLP5_9PEZI|nr:hypothetical protein B0T23DRAFT_408665 [Neurospora hispaniola]
MTAFFFSSFRHQVYFDARDGRGVISIAREKVAFSLCYSKRILLGAKFSYLGLPRRVIFYILAYYRQIRRAFLACGVGYIYTLQYLIRD